MGASNGVGMIDAARSVKRARPMNWESIMTYHEKVTAEAAAVLLNRRQGYPRVIVRQIHGVWTVLMQPRPSR